MTIRSIIDTILGDEGLAIILVSATVFAILLIFIWAMDLPICTIPCPPTPDSVPSS